jgi:hypothetical protein
LKTSIITVVGLNSKTEFHIDFDVIKLIANAFMQDAPRDQRTLKNVIDVVKLCEQLTEIANAEIAAVDNKVKEEIYKVIGEGILHEQAGLDRWDDEQYTPRTGKGINGKDTE